MKEQLFRYNTRNGVQPVLSDWFNNQLNTLITFQSFEGNADNAKTLKPQ